MGETINEEIGNNFYNTPTLSLNSDLMGYGYSQYIKNRNIDSNLIGAYISNTGIISYITVDNWVEPDKLLLLL